MKNFIKLFCYCGLFACLASYACALVKEKTPYQPKTHFSYTTFFDYPPFGHLKKDRQFVTVYQPFIESINEGTRKYIQQNKADSYEEAILDVINGHIDILFGAYYDTEKYRGIQLLYPSIVNNPVVPVILPDNELNIATKEDLKNLKGAIDKREHFSDYVANELKKLNVQEFDDSEKLYEQLFVGNIDYILTSRYYGALEQAKMGIRDMVQMSKTPIWDMPLFIGVSDAIKKGSYIKQVNPIKQFLKEHHEKLKEQINQLIVETIHQADEAARGVVPPAFVK